MKPRIYNRNMELVGVLQNASSVSYCRTHNDLFTASFQLPIDDPKTSLCDTHYIVDIFDGDVSKGKYRVLDEPDADFSNEGEFVKYSCEHVIAFLLNDVIDGYLETGGEGCTTRMVLEQLLAKQTTKRWQLGQCDFDYEFQYSWENTNLLDAIFSIPTCFADEYHWTYNTDSYPWTLNLIRQSTDRSCEIRRKRNMQQIKREKDSTALCTRLYCKGCGEGVNQLTISEVNNGKPYIDADTINTYGVLCSHYIDLTVTDAETLLAKGRAVLEGVKHPRYTYTAKAVDLHKITGQSWDEFDEGKYVHIIDDDGRLDIDAMIISVEKPDVDGDPLDMNIVISNKSSDVSSAIEDLAKRTAITAQYSQGATNLYSQQFADNADEEHPAVMRIYIPEGCAKINQILLAWKLEKFRAYERGASAGGGSESTSSAGGGSERTSSSGGNTVATVAETVISNTFACSSPVSSSGAGMASTSLNDDQTTGNSSILTTYSSSSALVTGENGAHTHTGPSHRHSVDSHTHSFSGSDSVANGHTHSIPNPGTSSNTAGVSTNVTHEVSISGTTGSGGGGNTGYAGTGNTGESGAHRHSMASHTHDMQHTHSVAGHSHTFTHFHAVLMAFTIPEQTITIPSHTHSVTIEAHTHTVKFNDHTHSIIYGIYEGDKADSCSLIVDGTAVTIPDGADELDIVRYLRTDSNGKITRGTWHEIEIVPSGLSRIEANLFVQTFVTSYSGGNY